jgi:uncharacterized phiE125 gp8 family phage protein
MNIITAAVAEPIPVTLARKQCRIDGDYEDELLEIYITAAREWAETELGRCVAPTLVRTTGSAFPADVASAPGTIVLETGPVQRVVGIDYDDEDGVLQTLDPALYAIDDTGEIPVVRLVGDATWPATSTAANPVRVNYMVGYSAVGDSPQDFPLPGRIKAAMLLVIGHLNANRQDSVEKALTTIPLGAKRFLVGISLRRGFA